jgi:lysozyme
MYDNIKEMLIKNEGLVCQPYHCSAGKLTIGVGRNLEVNGISEDEAMYLLENACTSSRSMCRYGISNGHNRIYEF